MPSVARKIAYVALITALGIVLNFLSFSVGIFGRASFVYLFANLAGIILGPFLGFASAAIADLIPAIFWPQGPWMPLLTLSQGLMALIPGLVFRYAKWKRFHVKLLVSTLASFLVATLGVGAWGQVPIITFFTKAMSWGEALGIHSPYLMLVIYKAATQPFWIAVNYGLTAVIYQPTQVFLRRQSERLRASAPAPAKAERPPEQRP